MTAQGANPGLPGTNQIPAVFRDTWARCVIPFQTMEWDHASSPEVFYLWRFTQGLRPGLL